MIVFKSRVIVVLSAAIYVFIAPIFFKNICDLFYFVQGYQCIRIAYTDIVGFSFAALLPAFFLPVTGKRPSVVVLWFVYYTHVVSIILNYPLFANVTYYGFFWVGLLIFLFCLVGYFSTIIVINLPHYSLSPRVFYMAIVLMALFCIYSIATVFGFSLELPSIDDVYGVRSEYKIRVADTGSLFIGYVVVVGGFVVAPVMLLLGLKNIKRNKLISFILMCIAIFLSYLIYGAGGFKSVAFAPFVCLFLYIISRNLNNYAKALSIGLPLLLLVIYSVAFSFDLNLLFDHWYRRIFMVPGINSVYFFEYFSSNPVSNFENPASVISTYYYGTDGSANSGLFGDGFARGGFLGMLLNSILFLFILVAMDASSKGIDSRFGFSLFFMTAYAISNSTLTSVFFTYGLFFLIMFFLIGKRVFSADEQSNLSIK